MNMRLDKFKPLNLIAFMFHTATTISLVVFLTSTQSFLLTTQIHTKPSQLGKLTGILTSMDEITCMILSPFVGTLLDYFSSSTGRFGFNGVSRIFGVIGITIMSLVLYGYTFVHTLMPYLIILRVLFAVGVSCAVGMFGVMLSEVVDSGFQLSQLNPFRSCDLDNTGTHHRLLEHDYESDNNNNTIRKSRGKFSALLGISSGVGAVFSVMNYLPLPDKYETKYGFTPEQSIIYAYKTVSFIGLFSAVVLNFTLYRRPTSELSSKPQYLKLLTAGTKIALKTPSIILSYLGSFLARSTSILNTVFIPLYIHTRFIQSGQCRIEPDQPLLKESCHGAYVQAMILTGVSNTVTLAAAPIYGIIIDKFGSYHALIGSFATGMVSCLFYFISSETLCLLTILASICLGLSQIGFIITSMALLTSSSNKQNIGAITGVYSLFGGFGILVLSGVGGASIDLLQNGKVIFVVMSVILGTIGLCCWYVRGIQQVSEE